VVKPLDTRYVQLQGPSALDGLKVARLIGREAISEPFEYELLLTGSEASASVSALNTHQILGQSATVTLTIDSSRTRYFSGIVTEFGYVGPGQRYHEYRAVLRPSWWLLTRRADCRIFQKKSTPDIFADVCQQAGSFPYRSALNRSYSPWDYRVQYRESDFDFVSRLLEFDGIYYYFEHSAGKHELVLTDDVGLLTSVHGYETVQYFPRTEAEPATTRDYLDVWSVNKSFQANQFALRDYNFEQPTNIQAGKGAVSGPTEASYEIFDYPAGSSTQTEVELGSIANVRAERLATIQPSRTARAGQQGLRQGICSRSKAIRTRTRNI
jgi:type VI secretion system secreted protein VgrG